MPPLRLAVTLHAFNAAPAANSSPSTATAGALASGEASFTSPLVPVSSPTPSPTHDPKLLLTKPMVTVDTTDMLDAL